MTVLNRAEFNRRCSERGENPMEPFWEESWAGLVEYERCLKQRNSGKNIRAMRTWNGIKNKGLIRPTESRVLNGNGPGFRTLMEAGKRESTDEYVVLKYRAFFSAKAIRKAQTRIEEWDREHSN